MKNALSFLFASATATIGIAGPLIAESGVPSSDEMAHDRLAFVQAACGGCHAVEPPALSPNPQAPPFEAIANRDGLTRKTLSKWLVDAHNYPEVMDFDLEQRQIDMIVDHVMTLKRKDYSPPPS